MTKFNRTDQQLHTDSSYQPAVPPASTKCLSANAGAENTYCTEYTHQGSINDGKWVRSQLSNIHIQYSLRDSWSTCTRAVAEAAAPVEIFMETIKYKCQQLLRVVLLETIETWRILPNSPLHRHHVQEKSSTLVFSTYLHNRRLNILTYLSVVLCHN